MTPPPPAAPARTDAASERRRHQQRHLFHAQDLGREWASAGWLAQVCERSLLTEPEARVVLLKYGFGMTSAGIAEALGKSENHVARMLKQARGKAGSLLREGGEAR